MKKRLLAVFAHPDDEAFGPGGTLALYARAGVEIHLLCATRGEAGQLHPHSHTGAEGALHQIREQELLRSAQIIGITKVEFLDFIDGQLSNALYHAVADKIMTKIRDFQPQVVLTFDRLGVSGHLDHIALSMMTTYAFRQTMIAQKLYYYCLSTTRRDPDADQYFIYFPEGYTPAQITTTIDYTAVWEIKQQAMREHKSQQHDVDRILRWVTTLPKVDTFLLHAAAAWQGDLPETDLFAGVAT